MHDRLAADLLTCVFMLPMKAWAFSTLAAVGASFLPPTADVMNSKTSDCSWLTGADVMSTGASSVQLTHLPLVQKNDTTQTFN